MQWGCSQQPASPQPIGHSGSLRPLHAIPVSTVSRNATQWLHYCACTHAQKRKHRARAQSHNAPRRCAGSLVAGTAGGCSSSAHSSAWSSPCSAFRSPQPLSPPSTPPPPLRSHTHTRTQPSKYCSCLPAEYVSTHLLPSLTQRFRVCTDPNSTEHTNKQTAPSVRQPRLRIAAA
jgi:hypothetical protein